MQLVPDEGARRFYDEAAAGAAALGVCTDVYIVSPEGCGLHLLEPLTAATGGAVYLYPSLEKAALPQVLPGPLI